LPAKDRSQPALALSGITVSPLPLIIVRFLSAAYLVLTATPAAFSKLNRNSWNLGVFRKDFFQATDCGIG
jgi:hypothetical protein